MKGRSGPMHGLAECYTLERQQKSVKEKCVKPTGESAC